MDEKKEKKKAGERAGPNGALIVRDRFPEGAQAKGGRAAAAKRLEKRKAKEILQDILCMAISDKSIEAGELESIAQGLAQEQGGSISVYQAIMIAQAARAMQGDTAAATYTRDTAGDKPTDKQEITGTITEGDKALCAAVAARLDDQKAHKE
nr:MAG TPA: hypothetical protein [Caudoviricetes sp.]